MTAAGPFLTTCARTDVGMRRRHNEDAFLLVDLANPTETLGCSGAQHEIAGRRMLLAVSDGMGGHAGGDVASSLALSTLVRSLATPSDGTARRRLDAAVHASHDAVLREAAATHREGMGATLTAVLIEDGVAWVAEVGDSRAYLLRGARLRQLTRDQSLVQMLVDTGVMTEEQARESARRNVLLQAIGSPVPIEVEVARLELRRGDRLLLCSDGLTNEVDDDELASLLSRFEPAAACDHAVGRANQLGGRDNVTAVVAMLDGEALPLPRVEETITGTHHVIQSYAPPPLRR